MCLAAGRIVPTTCVDHIEPYRGGYTKFRLGQWKMFEDRQNPSSIRLQARLRRRLTEDHIGALGRQSFLASTCDRRAKLATKLEPMGSATPANTGPTPPLRLAFPVNKIPISAAIEGRGAQAMVLLVLR
jgi:hypothetical protein